MKKINVLVLITVMDRAGAETMMMNYLRNINREKIHMDFLINREQKADYEDEIEKLGTEVHYFPTFDEIENFLLANCNDNDLLITMGAGDVYKIGEKLLGK